MSVEKLLEVFKNTNCLKETKTHYIGRCPFCGDSKKHLIDYGHLYVHKQNPVFICFRCNEHGHIRKLLKKYIEIGLLTPDDSKLILQHYTESKQNSFTHVSDEFVIQPIRTHNFNKKQVQYLNFRIGRELDYTRMNIYNTKYMFEYSNVLSHSNQLIEKIKNNKDFRVFLESNSISFVSYFKTIIIVRIIDETSKIRYLQLYANKYNPFDFYTPQLLDPYTIRTRFKEFIVAEGVFDILNQRVPMNREDKFFKIAVFGKSRLTKAEKIIYALTFQKPSVIHYYLDKDVLNDKHLTRILSMPKIAFRSRLYYNGLGKDMGSTNVRILELGRINDNRRTSRKVRNMFRTTR